MDEQFVLPAYRHCLNDILAAVFNTVGEAIIVGNESGEIVMLNKHVLQIWGYKVEDILGKSLELLMPQQYREMHVNGMLRHIETGEQRVLNRRLELGALHADGNTFPIQLFISETRIEEHRFFTAAIRDISDIVDARKKLEETQQKLLEAHNQIQKENKVLSEEVRLDPLTRTFNHVALKEQLSEEMERLSRSKKAFSLLFIDIDDFKKLNDERGHLYGDSCLRDLTHFIGDNIIRKIDTLGRYGGEEFLLIMPGIDVDGAILAGERLRRAIEVKEWQYKPLTVTIGAATAEEAMSVDALLDRADQAMYHGKQHGKNQLNHWDKLRKQTG